MIFALQKGGITMYDQEINEVLDKINILSNAYDNVRIVDPVKNRMIYIQENTPLDSGIRCYDFWSREEACENCISMQSYREQRTFIKLEYNMNEIYLVTAIPIEFSDQKMVLELIKNATDSISVNLNNLNEGGLNSELYAVLSNLNYIARKDSLTGLYNRGYLEEKLPIDLVNANLTSCSISVIMADIDSFEDIRETYGKSAGNCVLKKVGELLKSSLKRDNDWAARYGSQEFLVCLPGAPLGFAMEMAEKIRTSLEKVVIQCEEAKIPITVSFGAASVIPELGFTVEELVKKANQKLQEAKRNGGNRVEA